MFYHYNSKNKKILCKAAIIVKVIVILFAIPKKKLNILIKLKLTQILKKLMKKNKIHQFQNKKLKKKDLKIIIIIKVSLILTFWNSFKMEIIKTGTGNNLKTLIISQKNSNNNNTKYSSKSIIKRKSNPDKYFKIKNKNCIEIKTEHIINKTFDLFLYKTII